MSHYGGVRESRNQWLADENSTEGKGKREMEYLSKVRTGEPRVGSN